ncbi:MAG: radical SAM protein [Bryobacterales bacterium]|nr:radical SAM protein [Bryobacterales bacterium]
MILEGRQPFLSIKLTRQCPLRCPGCYAYAPDYAGETQSLHGMPDLAGDDLVEGVLTLVRKLRPLHVSLVGGEPLIRHKELDSLLPRLAPVEVQLVTSAVRRIPAAWAEQNHVHIVVSVDGLAPEHDRRRTPATYERILRNIEGHQVIVHCTVTRQLLARDGYLRDFAAFWSARPEARKIWFSLFTPQAGQVSEERLTPSDRARAIRELAGLSPLFPKVHMSGPLLDGLARPPARPSECIFAAVTTCVAPDLKTRIRPCELGGNAVCSECGCIASTGLSAVGRYRLAGLLPVATVFRISTEIGKLCRRCLQPAGCRL